MLLFYIRNTPCQRLRIVQQPQEVASEVRVKHAVKIDFASIGAMRGGMQHHGLVSHSSATRCTTWEFAKIGDPSIAS